MKTIAQSLIDQYVTHSGVRCINPDCLSEDISGGSVDIDSGGAFQVITCQECGWSWTDSHELIDVIGIEDENGKKVDVEMTDLNMTPEEINEITSNIADKIACGLNCREIEQYLQGIHKTKLIRCIWSLLERDAE